MIRILGGTEQDSVRFQHTSQNVHNLKIKIGLSGILHWIFLDQIWPWVTKTIENEIADKGWPWYFCFHLNASS